MRTHRYLTRTLATVLTAATVATSFPPTTASAAPASKPAVTNTDTLDISARRRHYRGNNAAALGMFAIVGGTIAAIAASQERRHYRRHYGYYGNPYGPAPYGYYGYGPRYHYGW